MNMKHWKKILQVFIFGLPVFLMSSAKPQNYSQLNSIEEELELLRDLGLEEESDYAGYGRSRKEILFKNICNFSEEAERVKLQQFLQKVQDKFFQLRPQELVYKSVSTAEFFEKFRLYDPSPQHILLETKESQKLLSEFHGMDINLDKLNPREEKALAQLVHFLEHVFGQSFHGNYYAGDFLLGPDYFCWQPLCDARYNIRYGLPRFQPSTEQETIELFNMVGKMFKQYKKNMEYGVQAGMVHSVEVCRASFDALKREYLNIALHGPKGVSSEWWAKPLLQIPFSSEDIMIEHIGKPIHDLLTYIETTHIRHCVPSEVASGLASLPVDYVYLDGKPINSSTKRLPDGSPITGRSAYEYLLSYSTTIKISPDEVYELGKRKLEEIYPQVLDIAKEVTKETDPEKAKERFVEIINQPDRFFGTNIPKNESGAEAHKKCSDEDGAQKHCPKRWAAMQKWFSLAEEALNMFEGKIKDLFHNKNPKRTTPSCGVQLKPDFNPSSAAASYVGSDKECSRKATYFIPFFMNKPGPVYEEWTTNAHEARPGHHYQLQGKEEFFKDNCDDVISWIDSVTTNSFTAYAEGWALYAESPLIAKDTDTYNDHPFFKYGMLKLQIWRALRLMVDTGLHHKGMKRNEAIELFKKYAWDDSDKTLKEITRYQGAPGQATAYMIGQLHFSNVRDFAQSKLGERFNLKDFHFYVLSSGDVPLGYMRKRMEKYASCVLKPDGAGCKEFNAQKSNDVVQDNLNEAEFPQVQAMEDDVWKTPRRHYRPIPR